MKGISPLSLLKDMPPPKEGGFMAKKGKEGTELEQTPAEPPATEPASPEVQPQTFTKEEVAALLLEKEKAYKGLQGVISNKDKQIDELRRRETVPAPNKTMNAMLELLEKDEGGYSEDPIRQAKIKALKEQLTREEQLQAQENYIRTEKEKLNQKIRDAGFDPDDDAFLEVNDAFDLSTYDGKFERAYKRADKVLKNLKPTPQSKEIKEIKPEDIEEAARKLLEEKGMLVSETGKPSASGGSFMEFEKAFIEGKIPWEEYQTRARKEGKV